MSSVRRPGTERRSPGRRTFARLSFLCAALSLCSIPTASTAIRGDSYPAAAKAAKCAGSVKVVRGVSYCSHSRWKGPNGQIDSPRGYAWRNCTDFVAWRANQIAGRTVVTSGWGNAANWGPAARKSKGHYDYDSHPRVNDIAWSDATNLGHVAIVTAVAKGEVTIEEYNWPLKGDSSYDDGLYHTRTVKESSFRYIHLTPKVVSPRPPTSLDPGAILNHIVRESGSGTSYYVTTGGPLASSGTLWHWIPDATTYNCLVESGAKVIQATWPQINKLRGAHGENEGPHAICVAQDAPPVITEIADLTFDAGDGRQAAPRVEYRDADCDVVGGTWSDATGQHAFTADADPSHPAACSNGVGYLTPGYSSCTAPDGTPSQTGRFAQTIVLRDGSGRTSAPFTFYVICR